MKLFMGFIFLNYSINMTNTINKIQKRDGTFVPYNEVKINLVIDYAAQNLDVDSDKLKEKIKLFIHEGMSTESIQKVLINNALSFVSLEEPNWKYVASKLLSLDMYKKAKRTQGYSNFGYGDYYSFVKKAVELGIYDKIILDKYNPEELKELGAEIKPEYDSRYDYAGMMSMHDRYLMKIDGKKIFELPQQMYMTCALMTMINEPKASRLKWVKKLYHACGNKYLSLATPILLNLRRPNGNLASCFIGAVGDGLKEIYHSLNLAALISKNAGGVGFNFSRVRGKGATIKGIKNASGGVTPWIKLFNDTAVAVNQLGSRSGAITCALDIWHIDIMSFLDIQSENGDQRNKSYDIFPQIVVNDWFLYSYKQGFMWYLFDPYEIRTKYGIELAELWGEEFKETYKHLCREADLGKLELVTKIPAREIVIHALQSAMETGMPYWFNKDTVNRANPNKHIGMIGSANLCVESFSNFSVSKPTDTIIEEQEDGSYVTKTVTETGYLHTCNLISLNASQIYEDNLEYYVRLAVRSLDNLLDIGSPPVPESQVHNDDYRILGIGMLGYHDHLIKMDIRYSDAESYTRKYWEQIAYYGIDESANLARDRGRYKYFEGSDWSKGIFFGKNVDQLITITQNNNLQWDLLISKVQKFGLRNGGLFAVAPNTGTGQLLGASASILPIFDLFFFEKNSLGNSPIVAQFISPETLFMYESFKNIDQTSVIDICAAAQTYIDQGISMELMLNLDMIKTAKELRDLYFYAMEKGSKTIYYLRSKSKKKKVKEVATEAKITDLNVMEDKSCMLCAN